MKKIIWWFSGIIFLPVIISASAFAQVEEEQITYDSDKGIYFVTYWSQVDSLYYEVPLFTGNECSPVVNSIIDKVGDEYRYSYNIFNDETAVRELYSFSLKINSNTIFNIKNPTSEWSYHNIEWKNLIRWAHTNFDSETLGILPGQEVGGDFEYSSNYPPALNKAFASSYWGLGNTPDEGPTGEIALKVDSLLQSSEHVILRTLGPKAPPDPFNFLDFLDTLRSYIPQARELGWVGDDVFTGELGDLLEDTRSRLAAGDSAAAAAVLKSFTELVEETNNGAGPLHAVLTSEGYALLYYNAAWLLERLPEPDETQPK